MKPCLHISIYVPGLPFDSKTLTSASLGGSETAGLSMARALRDLGHRIYLFCNTERPHEDDRIQFIPLESFPQFLTFIQHDVCLVQRMPEMLRNRSQAKLTVMWQHDMSLVRNHETFVASMWNTDKVALLSRYHVRQYREVHGDKILPDNRVWQTRNGIDLELFPKHSRTDQRDRKALVYSARPERGLDHLLKVIMPRLVEADPEIKLGICGYTNDPPHMASFYNHCRQLAAALGQNVAYLGNLPKPKLYELYSKAGLYVYPTPSPISPKFREISCISLMEAQAAGLPVVASAQGALPETLHRRAGRLIKGLPGEPAHDDAFVDAVLDLVQSPSEYQKASAAGRRRARQLSWKGLAKEWEAYFIEQIQAKNADPVRAATYFSKTGDRVTASDPSLGGAVKCPSNDGQGPKYATPEQCAILARWLEEAGAKDVLDFGQLVELRDALKGVNFHTDPADGPFDAVVLVNDLEYRRRPWARLEEAERHVRPGGFVMASTPHGPWRLDERMWNFETSDVEDMVGGRRKFDLFAHMQTANPLTGDPIGWVFTRYQVDKPQAVPTIQMKRKLQIQAPRETLSVNIIAGGDKVEQTLHWCLRSVRDIADEIIIANTGMTEEALRIARQYPVKIIPASNPLEVGFEVPRNEALEASSGDWILWIDTDERLVGPEYLTKYLRANVFDGYGIRQHHYGIGIHHEPDMPVRLFRRNGKIRFYGRIHEHPEQAINKGPGLVVVISDVNIVHVGYESEKVREGRFARNQPLLEMDKRDYPDRILQKHMIMRDNMILANIETARNGGQVTEQVRELCEDTIALWRKYFRGGTELVGVNSLPYYNRACEILGLGVDVAFQLEAGRDGYGAQLNGKGMRFANEEDLMAELKWQVKTKTEPYLKDMF